MSKDSVTNETSSLSLPKAPGYVTEPLEGIIGAAYNLGGRNPQDFVPGPTSNDLASFAMGNNIASRYGASPQYGSSQPRSFGQPNPNSINVSRSQSGSSGLFPSLGIRQPNQTNYDWDAIAGDRPDLQAAYGNLTPQQHADIAKVTGNPDGRVSLSDFARYQVEENAPNRPPEYEQRMRELSGFSGGAKGSDPRIGGNPGVVDMGGGRYGPGGFNQNQLVQMGQPTSQPPAPQGFNPLALYEQAANGTRAAGAAGPNHIDNQSVFDLLMSQDGPSVSAATMSAAGLMDNGLDQYIDPYNDQVRDTTLDLARHEQAKAEAQRAATAAGSGANRGTRNSIFEAVAQIDRERELANLSAQIDSAGFQQATQLANLDAGRRQEASATNAQLRQQANERNALMEQERLRAATDMMFNQSMFNADQGDEALNRMLSGSAQLADLGNLYQNNERQDIGLLSQLGAQERDIQRQQSTADIALLDTIANLLGGMGVNTSQVTGVANSGSSTQRANPGLLSTIGSVVDIAGNVAGIGTGIQDSGSKRIAALGGI